MSLNKWMTLFNGLEDKLRKSFSNHSLESAILHMDRDMGWIMRKLPNDEFAQMEMTRIKMHIIGLVRREKELAIFRYASNRWFKRGQNVGSMP